MPSPGTERASATVRALRAADSATVTALTDPEIERLHRSATLRSAVDAVLSAPGPESRGLVAVQDGQVAGVVVYGAIAGSVGAGRLQLIVVAPHSRHRGIASALIHRALEELVADRMRVAFIELPDDPELSAVKQLLLGTGFHIDARVADFFCDGVDLAILRRDLLQAE